MEKSWNCVFEILWEPCIMCQNFSSVEDSLLRKQILVLNDTESDQNIKC